MVSTSEADIGRMADTTEKSTLLDEKESPRLSIVVDNGETWKMHRERKAVLFGKTGAGKSTIANTLVTGGTGGIGEAIFKSSHGVLGCTKEFQHSSGRNWNVLDTVGQGEAAPNGDTGSAANTKPEDRLVEYLQRVKGEYSHIIYVMKAERFTTIDAMIWFLFTQIFKGGEDAFVILFTGEDQNWLQKWSHELPDDMKAVQNKVMLNIPPQHNSEIIEAVNIDTRREEIQKLEEKLQGFFQMRDYEYVRPLILDLNQKETREEAKSIIQRVVKKLKTLFERENWVSILKVMSVVVGIVLSVAGLLGVA